MTKHSLGLVALTCLTLWACTSKQPPSEKITVAPKKGELALAVSLGSLEKTKELLFAGADINENIGTAEQPVTPLMISLAGGDSPNDSIAAYLIAQGANAEVGFPLASGELIRVRDWACQTSDGTNATGSNSCVEAPQFIKALNDRDSNHN